MPPIRKLNPYRDSQLARVRPLRMSAGRAPETVRSDHSAPDLFQVDPTTKEGSEGVDVRIPRAFDHEIAEKRAAAAGDAAEEIFERSFREENMTLEDFFPWRVQAAWRLVRALALLRGEVAVDETLSEATGFLAGKSPWTYPTASTCQDSQADFSLSLIADTVTRTVTVPDTLKIQVYNEHTGEFQPANGFALLPPPVPAKFLDGDGNVTDEYNPEHDPLLGLYIKTMSALCDRLGIDKGWEKDPEGGRYGIIGLFDPWLVRLAFPTPIQIVSWELTLLDEAIELMTRRGMVGASDLLKQYYGLTPPEISSVLAMAKQVLAKRTEFDIEAERNLMVRRLESIALQANNAMDLDSELKALKQISLIQGLTKSEPEDENDLFSRSIRAFTDERESLLLEAKEEE